MQQEQQQQRAYCDHFYFERAKVTAAALLQQRSFGLNVVGAGSSSSLSIRRVFSSGCDTVPARTTSSSSNNSKEYEGEGPVRGLTWQMHPQ